MEIRHIIIVFTILAVAMAARNRKPRDLGNMDKTTYDTIVQLVQGTFRVAVAERTRLQLNACIRYHRHKNNMAVKDGKLTYYGKEIIVQSDHKRIIAECHDKTKGSGSRKIYQHLKKTISGISENVIQRHLLNDPISRRLHMRFTDESVPKPIEANSIDERHQVDLMMMKKSDFIWHKDKRYAYIMTLLDVFSRFVWLFPLAKKSSKVVAKHLNDTYMVFTKPKILQSDNGTEFKGQVNRLCKRLNIKQIRSRPFHPQSQGKVERVHRTLRRKIKYDKMKSNATPNWVKNIKAYQAALNNDMKRELSNNSPSDVYYGRTTGGKTADEIRKESQKATKKWHNYTIRRYRGIVREYSIGEKVYLQIPKTKKKTEREVYEAVIEAINEERGTYIVSYNDMTGPHQIKVTGSDITKHMGKGSKRVKRAHRQRFYIVEEKNREGCAFQRPDKIIDLEFDPERDGNCQFSAVCNQVSKFGIYRSAHTMREEVVHYLKSHRIELEGFVSNNSWDSYISDMSKNSTFGDHLTLQAMAKIYSIDIAIISSNGHQHDCVIRGEVQNVPNITLGHFSENNGAHYVCLSIRDPENDASPNQSSSEDSEKEDGDDDLRSHQSSTADGEKASRDDNTMSDHNSKEDDVEVDSDDDSDVASNCSRGENENDHGDKNISNLSVELINKIIGYTDFVARQQLRQTCKQFNDLIKTLPKPSIHIHPCLEADLILNRDVVSVKRLKQKAGPGLGAELKTIIARPNWNHAWLDLDREGPPGMFTIAKIFWRKRISK